MITQPFQELTQWVSYFGQAEIPILRKTARQLEEAHAAIDSITGRSIAAIVLQDPLLAVRVLAYIQPFRGKHLRTEITTIGGAVMMLGVEPFFSRFNEPLTVETLLKNENQALLGLLQVIRRAQRASRYAYEWALDRHDLNAEEVALAALLHDLAEILLWCFAPHLALQIRAAQAADPKLRSTTAQQSILGIKLFDLQLSLCEVWGLPELLKDLMNDSQSQQHRVQNVVLAVNLARHSANDWHNPALPDDFSAICKLLHINLETLIERLGLPQNIAEHYLQQAPQAPEKNNN